MNLMMLEVLQELCRHKKAAKAAQVLDITQPAVSHYIKQLRALTGEELFIRTKDGVSPTNSCLELNDLGQRILDLCEEFCTKDKTVFDPDADDVEYKVAVPFQDTRTFFEGLTIKLLKDHPNMRMNLIYLSKKEAIKAIEDRELDLYLGLMFDPFPKYSTSEELHNIEMSVLCSKHNPLYKTKILSKDAFCDTPHIKVSAGTQRTPIAEKLRKAGLTQKTRISVPNQYSAFRLLLETDYLYIVAKKTAETLSKEYDFAVLEPNFELPQVTIHQIWNRKNADNPKHVWLREYVRANFSY